MQKHRSRQRGLTPLQQQLLTFISNEIRTSHRPPTCREMAAAMGVVSTSAIQSRLHILERHGLIVRRGGARSVFPASLFSDSAVG
jgi:SOS-response transcriptional repressor LexA